MLAQQIGFCVCGRSRKRQNPLISQRVFHCLISEQAFSHCAENGGFEQAIVALLVWKCIECFSTDWLSQPSVSQNLRYLVGKDF